MEKEERRSGGGEGACRGRTRAVSPPVLVEECDLVLEAQVHVGGESLEVLVALLECLVECLAPFRVVREPSGLL